MAGETWKSHKNTTRERDAERDHADQLAEIDSAEHGSDANRFVPGAWPGCRCGYRPRDNAKLNRHFAEHGFREVDDHGMIVRYPVEVAR